ncbi:MAG: endonuclease/exonuclease/phosphatase family protein [Verrucomicrobiota bacterium]|nr:endonuclease/exonuclease/phosphatase family protein [Verrucomicrobiota bacterium]
MLRRAVVFAWLVLSIIASAERVSIATFNVDNYLLEAREGRRAKASDARRAVHVSLKALRADMVVLQEIGSQKALTGIRQALAAEGLEYAHSVFSRTPGSLIHMGLLARFPPVKVRHHATNVFVLYGRPFRPSRAFLEVDLALPGGHRLKIMAAHLKSKRPVGHADQWDLRTREALLLRSLVDARLKENPDLFLAVVGDFNDGPSSQTLRFLKGAPGSPRLMDGRPREGRPARLPHPPRGEGQRYAVWTYHYAAEDLFSRIDFVLMSQRLFRCLRPDESCVLNLPNWGMASDHRPVLVSLELPP